MHIEVTLAAACEVDPLRELYRQEMNCQIIRDSWHRRGFANAFLLRLGDRVVGYGLVGGAPGDPRDAIVEFFVFRDHRGDSLRLFRKLIEVSQARRIEVQSNDLLLFLMLFDFADNIQSHAIVFHDAKTTCLVDSGAKFRRTREEEKSQIFPHSAEPVGDWVIESERQIVATGGVLFHYNPPYGDLYMEVAEPFRRRGFGSYLIQELKRITYEMGKIPAARCNAANTASRATLQKAGMLPCGRLFAGTIREGLS